MTRLNGIESELAHYKSQYEQSRQNEELYRMALSLKSHIVTVVDIPNRTINQIHHEGDWPDIEDSMSNAPESVIKTGIIHLDDQDEFRAYFEQIYEGVPAGECTIRAKEGSGSWVWLEMSYRTIFDDAGNPLKAIAFSDDITEQKEKEERLLDAAERDMLCGIYNRKAFEHRIANMLIIDRRTRGGYIFMIDIDDFKDYNDQYGHIVGDEILQGLGQALRDCFRKDDLLGRFGGDEFMAFAPNITYASALARAEKLKEYLRILECSKPLDRTVTLSIGIAEVTEQDDFTSLYSKSDEALYTAKSKGKSCSVVWSA